MFGNETLPKDVLEYIIFERVLTNPYSQWRVHSKIVPAWFPQSDPLLYTFEKPNIEAIDEDTPTDTIEEEDKREKIAQEHETMTKTIPGPNEFKPSVPTISNTNKPVKKKTIGYI